MWKKRVQAIIQAITAISLIVIAYLLLRGDFIPFIKWWLTILCIGIVFLPITSHIFSTFHDKGYLFSKTIGIAISGYLMWLLASLHILKFTVTSCIIAVVIGLLLNLAFLLYQMRLQNGKQKLQSVLYALKGDVLNAVVTEELLFLAIFIVFIYIKGFKPEVYGTEKFMDYGFMTNMMRSDFMPPQDLWFSGTSINYYYVGQYMATFLTKLSFVKVSYGYNLMLMMIGAFAVMLPFSLCYNLIRRYLWESGKKLQLYPVLAGLLGGAAVCIAGNMHYPVFKWWVPSLKKMLGVEPVDEGYWFPDATRYIGYNPETNDKTIHEFPSYSFVLGDLHAHVINILFVLTVLGILFAWQQSRKKADHQRITLWKEIVQPSIVMIGFFIGLFHMTNFWDFPIYYVVAGAIILFSNMVVYNFKRISFLITTLQGIFIWLFSEVVCLPFTLNFDQISTSIQLTVARTPLYQLMILWGLPMLMVIAFLAFLIACFLRYEKKLKTTRLDKKRDPLFRFMDYLNDADLFVLTIGLCAIGLILIPEVIYVQDIYSGDYKRANTMFKLTYQAYILFGISMGYLFVRLIRFGETIWQRIYALIGLIFFSFTLCYAGTAVKSWFGDIFDRTRYEGIDATAFMEKTMPEDYLAIKWLNENVSGLPVTLEANGDSYTDYERISVMTGLPTLLGWRTHEWLWKGDPSLLDVRAADIQTIYTSDDTDQVKSLIEQYKIQYIYVGKLEQEKFVTVNHELIKELGEVVYEDLRTGDKTYETYIVRISN